MNSFLINPSLLLSYIFLINHPINKYVHCPNANAYITKAAPGEKPAIVLVVFGCFVFPLVIASSPWGLASHSV